MDPRLAESKLEEAVPKQKTSESDSLTLPHRAKETEETATQQAASQQVKAELKLAVEAAEGPHNIKSVPETGCEPSGQRVKRRHTKRMKRPLFAPYGPTDPDRQGASFRLERTEDEEDTVVPEEVDDVPGAYPKYPDRTYYPDGSWCS